MLRVLQLVWMPYFLKDSFLKNVVRRIVLDRFPMHRDARRQRFIQCSTFVWTLHERHVMRYFNSRSHGVLGTPAPEREIGSMYYLARCRLQYAVLETYFTVETIFMCHTDHRSCHGNFVHKRGWSSGP